MPVAAEEVYAALRQGILLAEYTPGSRLREQDLSAELGVSRTPVREALRRLRAEGLVEFAPNRGAVVAAWDDHELEDLFELRALLEGYAARRSAIRISREDIDRLHELQTQMDEVINESPGHDMDVASLSQLNQEFHRLALQNSGYDQLNAFIDLLNHLPVAESTLDRYTKDGVRISADQHRELIRAYRSRDEAWAESAMRSHVLAARHMFEEAAPGES